MTPKQIDVVDALHNGGYIWSAGGIYFLARASHHSMGVYYTSERINRKTFVALEGLLVKQEGVDRWSLG